MNKTRDGDKILLEVSEVNDLCARIVKTAEGFRLDVEIDGGPGCGYWEPAWVSDHGHSSSAYAGVMLRLAECIKHNAEMIKDGQMDVEV